MRSGYDLIVNNFSTYTGKTGCWLRIGFQKDRIFVKTTALLDTGSAFSLAPHQILEFCNNTREIPQSMRLVGASGTEIKGECLADAIIRINGQKFRKHTFFILSQDSYLRYVIIGIDLMKKFNAKLDIAEQTVTFTTDNNTTFSHAFELKKNSNPSQAAPITVNTIDALMSDDANGELQQSENRTLTTPLADILCKISEENIDLEDGDDEIQNYDLNPNNLDLSHLDKNIQEKVRKMISDNLGAFAKHSEHIGCVPYDLFHTKIDLEEGKYAWTGLYKRNPKESKILDKMEKKMLRMGVFGLKS